MVIAAARGRRLARRGLVVLALSVLRLASAWGASIYDDIRGNDLPALRRKVELLDMSLAEEPYLAFYFRNAREFRGPVFEYLIEHGADPNMADANGVYPIHWAIKGFGAREVAALLERGANPSFTVAGKSLDIVDIRCDMLAGKGYGGIGLSSRGSIWNSIALSVYFQKPEILSLFLDELDPTAAAWLWTAKDSPKDQLNLIELPFWKKRLGSEGLSGGSARCFAILWKRNMALPPEGRIQLSPDYEGSLLATLEDDLPALKRYLAHDMENSIRYLPYAIVSGSLECLDFLMKFNDLNARSFVTAYDLDLVHGVPTETVPLYAYALMNGDLEMLEWFGDRGADFNKSFRYDRRTGGGALDHNQSGALSAAIRMDLGIEFATYLLSKGADPNVADLSNPLLLALASDREELASLLLDAGADPNLRIARKTIMSQAALTASPAILELCLDKRGSVAISDSLGWTALHYAVCSGDLEKIRLLVDAKANLSARTGGEQRLGGVIIPYGSTPADIAKRFRKAANSDSQQRRFDEILAFLAAPQKPSSTRK